MDYKLVGLLLDDFDVLQYITVLDAQRHLPSGITPRLALARLHSISPFCHGQAERTVYDPCLSCLPWAKSTQCVAGQRAG
jgi:hypothetical protein